MILNRNVFSRVTYSKLKPYFPGLRSEEKKVKVRRLMPMITNITYGYITVQYNMILNENITHI